MTAAEIARALGGHVAGRDAVLAPGPGHSPRDRSLSVRIDPAAPDGLLVYSHAGDDWRACCDHVRQRLGLPPRTPRCRFSGIAAPADDASRIRAALRIWSETVPLDVAQNCAPQMYLINHRRLDVRGLDLSHALRWHAGIGAVVALMTD